VGFLASEVKVVGCALMLHSFGDGVYQDPYGVLGHLHRVHRCGHFLRSELPCVHRPSEETALPPSAEHQDVDDLVGCLVPRRDCSLWKKTCLA